MIERGHEGGMERGVGVIEIGRSGERVFRCSIQYSVYGVVFFMYCTLGHFGCVGRLVFVAGLRLVNSFPEVFFLFPGIREWSFSFPGIPGARE